MSAVLMDTNALIWFMNSDYLEPAALSSIAVAQNANALLVSPFSAWEAALALRKKRGRPDLGGRDAATWFRAVLKVPGTQLARPSQRIAIEAADVPAIFGHGDPGDCFLIATAHIRRVPIVTRDSRMHELAAKRPDYLQTIRC
jgi:PIN domain nuclease of toxin-antitoxin system